jgi:hypothetical protein
MREPEIRQRLVEVALEWQRRFGVAPSITTAVSELDAALLVGMPIEDYSQYMSNQTAVARGSDFVWDGVRYQVKANRPSGKPGSRVTLVPKAKNYEWDYLIWLLYDESYALLEAWMWDVDEYRSKFDEITRLSPKHYRQGKRLYA